MVRNLLVILPLLFTSSTVFAKEQKTNEYFIHIQIPKNFYKSSNILTDEMTGEEFIPSGQTANNWREMITILYIESNLEPLEYYQRMVKEAIPVCESLTFDKPIIIDAHGFKIIRGATTCGKAAYSGLGEFTNYSIVQKDGSIYMLQRAMRMGPFIARKNVMPLNETTLHEWANFFKSVGICHKQTGECVRI